jgi:hypothetical protein
MEKRDICFDYIRGECNNYKCQYGHVIVNNKEEFLKKHADRIRVRFTTSVEYEPSFMEIHSISDNRAIEKVISKCIKCQKGFLVAKDKILSGDIKGKKCKDCLYWG